MSDWKLTRFTRSIWYNKLLRKIYKRLPLPWHIRQLLKQIYLRRPVMWKPQGQNTFPLDANREALPLLVASAQQFDPAESWVLLCDLRLPTPNQDRGSSRISAILQFLQETGFRITFVSDCENPLPHYQEILKKSSIRIIHGFKAAHHHLAAEGGKYHFVLLSGPEIAFKYLPYVRAYALHAYIIYDVVDLHGVRLEREMQFSSDAALLETSTRLRHIELLNVTCADLAITATNDERDRLLTEQPHANIIALPTYVYEISPTKIPFAQRRGLLLTENVWHKHDEEAVIAFVEVTLPRITEKITDLIFYIIGRDMPIGIKSLRSANVEPLGFVPDITPYFESCRIFVAPLRFGTGVKGEVSHSLSHGLPTVATRIGAEGMDLRHEKHLLIADDPGDFANMVVRLYNDETLWHRLSDESLMHLATNYSLAVTRKRMIDIFARKQDESSRGGCHEDNTAIPTCSASVSF